MCLFLDYIFTWQHFILALLASNLPIANQMNSKTLSKRCVRTLINAQKVVRSYKSFWLRQFKCFEAKMSKTCLKWSKKTTMQDHTVTKTLRNATPNSNNLIDPIFDWANTYSTTHKHFEKKKKTFFRNEHSKTCI